MTGNRSRVKCAYRGSLPKPNLRLPRAGRLRSELTELNNTGTRTHDRLRSELHGTDCAPHLSTLEWVGGKKSRQPPVRGCPSPRPRRCGSRTGAEARGHAPPIRVRASNCSSQNGYGEPLILLLRLLTSSRSLPKGERGERSLSPEEGRGEVGGICQHIYIVTYIYTPLVSRLFATRGWLTTSCWIPLCLYIYICMYPPPPLPPDSCSVLATSWA